MVGDPYAEAVPRPSESAIEGFPAALAARLAPKEKLVSPARFSRSIQEPD